jgi:hypothetical protein
MGGEKENLKIWLIGASYMIAPDSDNFINSYGRKVMKPVSIILIRPQHVDYVPIGWLQIYHYYYYI